jgi:DNA polymerase III delta prime subunit
MPNYDFKQLSPHDFEVLSRDLIQARDQVFLESFKSGKDDGIDFRHASATGAIIVQCKHYAESGLARLLRDLTSEAGKVAKLRPTRYILVTSVGLSPHNKTAIQNMFGIPLSTGDILGKDDLNNLLSVHSDVENRHFKLWLASKAVLDRALHNASVVQSEFEVERVYSDIKRYVSSDAYPRAQNMLSNDHVAIISGPPGVGKTTLAKMLLYYFTSEGYEPISILTDFQTGRERFHQGRKQIFYFDDFIGATFLGERATAFTRNEDRAILDFIELIKGSPNARLVMTTREHILMQAIATSEKLKHSDLIGSRCVLEIRDYSLGQRAEILYNHVYFSDLPENYRTVLLTNRFYHEIVKHKKFNPRLIEWLSTFRRVKDVGPEQYADFVRGLLANPAEIWRHAYEHQISSAAHSLLLALYSVGGRIGPLTLERLFQNLHGLRAQRYGFATSPADWRSALAELNGSFIRPGVMIEVIDPSVLDMLNMVVLDDVPNALDMIEGAIRFEQVRRIWNFARADAPAVMRYLMAESDRVAVAFERLLHAPSYLKVSGGITRIDDSIETRVSLLLQVAEVLSSASLSKVAVASVEKLIADWNETPADIGDGVELLAKIESSSVQFNTAKPETRKRIIFALAASAREGCTSDEFHDLLKTIRPEEVDPPLHQLLEAAARNYRESHFRVELGECQSEVEYSTLERGLAAIAGFTNVDFEGPLHAVEEAQAEFIERQEAYADQQADDWKEMRHEQLDTDKTIDDLFDSLRCS